MKQITLLVCAFYVFTYSIAQTHQEWLDEITTYQQKLNEKFINPETSILKPTDFVNFTGLEFYPIDLKYRIDATFKRTPDELPFLMPTTTDRLPEYVKYGEVYFTIDNQLFKLDIFQNIDLTKKEGFENYLFLPFSDLTSGNGSYGGGRYLDLIIPLIDSIRIDFNKSYNPYCAYNEKYSCPIPPEQNDLKINIEAGVKDFIKP